MKKKPHWPLPIGSKIYVQSEDPGPLHVRGHVDGHIVVRFWVPWKKRWAYEVKSKDWFDVWFEGGRAYIETPKRKSSQKKRQTR